MQSYRQGITFLPLVPFFIFTTSPFCNVVFKLPILLFTYILAGSPISIVKLFLSPFTKYIKSSPSLGNKSLGSYPVSTNISDTLTLSILNNRICSPLNSISIKLLYFLFKLSIAIPIGVIISGPLILSSIPSIFSIKLVSLIDTLSFGRPKFFARHSFNPGIWLLPPIKKTALGALLLNSSIFSAISLEISSIVSYISLTISSVVSSYSMPTMSLK